MEIHAGKNAMKFTRAILLFKKTSQMKEFVAEVYGSKRTWSNSCVFDLHIDMGVLMCVCARFATLAKKNNRF